MQIGDQSIAGWQVTERNSGLRWLLFERDGTLIALEDPTPETLALLGKLQQLDRVTP